MSPSAATLHLLHGAAGGALVLTSTKRLARRLRRDLDRLQGEKGLEAWPTPAIYSADVWLRRAAETLGEGGRFLGRDPARLLWERIVDGDDSGAAQGLLQAAATARRAEEAHALLCEYGGDLSRYPLTADHVSFLRWRGTYRDLCERDGWLDQSALAVEVLRALSEGRLLVPKVVWIAGFDDLPPRLRLVSEAFAAHGTKVYQLPPAGEPPGELLRLPCADPQEEVRSAARWVRDLLERGEAEIGVIVPDLERYRSLIERIFTEEIDPAARVFPGAEETRFSLSLGFPLAATGAVVAALEILSAERTMPLAKAGLLLRSPFLGGSLREEILRAHLDRELRTCGEPIVSLSHLRRLAEIPHQKSGRDRAPVLAAIVHRLLAETEDRQKRLPGSWGLRFAEILQVVGWPGERPLDSFDFQAVKAWREKVLSPLASLDLVSGPVSRGEAVALVRRLATETEFQTEGPESPVQVVGLLEASGLRFRHLWVMGLHDGVLPAAPAPNPFLPIPLQVAAGMPHCNAAREGEFARKVVRRLFAAAPSVVLSHPLREGDCSLLPSPFICDLPKGEIMAAPSRAPIETLRQRPVVGEEFIDAAGPPLAPEENISGGTSLLKDQALCPFRAFMRHRLAVAALEEPDIGLDPRDRGTLLHKTLELFWSRTRDRAGLLSLPEKERRKRIDECIAAAVDLLHPEGSSRPDSFLLSLERERLLILVGEWLEMEALRPDFAVIEREGEHQENLGGVTIRSRVDRVDDLKGGGQVILDYKTGNVDLGDLIAERLVEPQIPIYALSRGEELAAVAFANLRRGNCAFAGVAREEGILPKVTSLGEWKKAKTAGFEEWKELLSSWRDKLQALGGDFVSGAASVDPVSDQKACRTCDLVPLCRTAERRVVAMGEEE